MIGGVDFEEKNHVYTKAGVYVPAVSTILNFMQLNPNVRFYKPSDALRGTYVHKITELIDQDNLAWYDLDPILLPYAEAYKLFTKNESFKWEYTEQILFNENLWYAGTADRIGKFRDSNSVIDFKSGNGSSSVSHGIQTAGYDICIPGGKRKRWVVFLRPNGTYKVEEYKDPEDYPAFEKAVWLWHWSKRNKII